MRHLRRRLRRWHVLAAAVLGVAVVLSAGVARAASPPPCGFHLPGQPPNYCTHYQSFALHAATPIALGDYTTGFVPGVVTVPVPTPFNPDVLAFKARNTASGQVELYDLSGYHGFRQIDGVLPLPINGQDFAANYARPAVGDYNRDGTPDLYLFKVRNTGTGTLEVHVLDGATNYSTFLLETGTRISAADADANLVPSFGVADFNGDGILDLYTFRDRGTWAGLFEIDVLNGLDNYQTPLANVSTQIAASDFVNSFAPDVPVGDYNKDGKADVFTVKRANTGTGRLELHVLDGLSGYRSFALQTGTAIGSGDATGNGFQYAVGDYTRDGVPDLFAIKPLNTGSGRLEVHILDGNVQSVP